MHLNSIAVQTGIILSHLLVITIVCKVNLYYTHVPDPQPTPRSIKMVSMTKFDSSGTAEWWLGILEGELSEDFTPATWLKQTNIRLDGRAVVGADKTPEIKQNLQVTNATIAEKDVFIWLSYEEFAGSNQSDVMTKDLASSKLSTLSQKKNEDFYIYYC